MDKQACTQHYLSVDGRPAFLVGLNYWPRAAGPTMWRNWDADAVGRELKEMAALGLNVFRSFLFMPDFVPQPDRLDGVMLERFAQLLELCARAHIQHQADYYHTVLHTVLLAGGAGALGWCFSDFDLPNQRPYSHHPFEMRFGVTESDGRHKPAACELRQFAELVSSIDLTQYHLPESETAIVVPSHNSAWRYPFWAPDTQATYGVLLQAYVLAHQAHLGPTFLREPPVPTENGVSFSADGIPRFPVDKRLVILPHCQTLTAPGFEALLDYAAQGGTVYYSYHTGPGAHNFEELFGCQHELRWGLVDSQSEEIRLVFEEPFGAIRPGEELHYRRAGQHRRGSMCPVVPTRAKVVARDGRGNPALLVDETRVHRFDGRSGRRHHRFDDQLARQRRPCAACGSATAGSASSRDASRLSPLRGCGRSAFVPRDPPSFPSRANSLGSKG